MNSPQPQPSGSYVLCPKAPHGPHGCGMVAVQIDAQGHRYVCTLCFDAAKTERKP